MILTEQNRNPERLGETRAFSVPENQSVGHSADTMKKRINASNEQALTQKNQAMRNAVAGNRNAQPSVRNLQNTQNPANRASTVNNTSGVRTVQPNARAVQSNARAVQPNARAVQPNARTVQNRSNQQNRADAPQVKANKPIQNTAQSRAVQRVQADRSAVKAERQKSAEKSVSKPVSAETHSKAQLMRTKVTDVTYMQSGSAQYEAKNQKADKNNKKERRQSSGEGGNTVVSVIKAIVYIIFVIVISIFLALVVINVGNDMFSFVKSDEMVEVTIPEYATLDEVTDILYMNDIIKYPTIFKLYAVAEKADTDFLAGTYSVNGMMNYETLLGEFKEKPESGTVDITIPEGYTIDEIIDLFVEGYHIGTREGFVDVIQNGEFDYWFIKELEENGVDDGRLYRLEGYLFPDTYQFYKSTSEYTVVNKLLKRFSQIFTKEYRAQCETLGYTVDEMITLASIIEKEAGSPSDFFVVSSVFHNRLKSPWEFPRLESDATVVYILSHEKGERVGVTADDLKLNTPYNTYLYEGFPPGPIANPSASAMLAALSPQNTNYYYFITNKGILYPSATKAEHDAYVAQFRNETAAQQTTGDMPE